jgi:hypothetical protein
VGKMRRKREKNWGRNRGERRERLGEREED